jgi:hypothetical protein
VFKELDYAISVNTRPYANSGIGEAFSAASNAQEDEVFLVNLRNTDPLMTQSPVLFLRLSILKANLSQY